MNKLFFYTTLFALFSTIGLYSESLVKERKKKTTFNLIDYNYNLGDVYLDAAYRLKLGNDDNASSSQDSSTRTEGFYYENALKMKVFADFSDSFKIDTDFVVGFRNWVSGNNDDYLILQSNGDTLAFDWDLSEKTRLSLVERARVNVYEVQDTQANQGSKNLQMFKNDVGLQLFTHINEESSYGIKFGRRDVKSMNGDFENRERFENYVGLKYNAQISPKTKVSPYYNYQTYSWKKNGNNDAKEWQAGLEIEHKASKTMLVTIYLGWQEMIFDVKNQTVNDSGRGLEGGVKLAHQISETLSHNISAKSTRRISTSSSVNFADDFNLTYGVKKQFNSKFDGALNLNWFHSEDHIGGGEKYNVYVPSVNIGYQATAKSRFDFNFRYTEKRSDRQNAEYDRSQVYLMYTFNF